MAYRPKNGKKCTVLQNMDHGFNNLIIHASNKKEPLHMQQLSVVGNVGLEPTTSTL